MILRKNLTYSLQIPYKAESIHAGQHVPTIQHKTAVKRPFQMPSLSIDLVVCLTRHKLLQT